MLRKWIPKFVSDFKPVLAEYDMTIPAARTSRTPSSGSMHMKAMIYENKAIKQNGFENESIRQQSASW